MNVNGRRKAPPCMHGWSLTDGKYSRPFPFPEDAYIRRNQFSETAANEGFISNRFVKKAAQERGVTVAIPLGEGQCGW